MASKKSNPPKSNQKAILSDAKRQRQLAKKQAQKLAKEQVKEMRRYSKSLKSIDLRKQIKPAKLRQVKKTWEQYQSLTTRGHVVFRSKKKDKLKEAQQYSQMPKVKGAAPFDVAFIPTSLSKPKIKFTKSGIRITQGNLTETPVQFDMANLASNPNAEIDRILLENPNAEAFLLMCGPHTFNGLLTRKGLREKVLHMMMQYSPGGDAYGRGKGGRSFKDNHYKNWLNGAYIVDMGNQQDNLKWLKDHRDRNEQKKKEKAKQRALFRRKYGKAK
jgi:hypothetical protein